MLVTDGGGDRSEQCKWPAMPVVRGSGERGDAVGVTVSQVLARGVSRVTEDGQSALQWRAPACGGSLCTTRGLAGVEGHAGGPLEVCGGR